MTEVSRCLADGAKPPFWVLAESQTHGRGRRGKAWSSGAGGNFHGTLLLEKDDTQPQRYGFLFGLAAYKALVELFPDLTPHLRLKWPNDFLLKGRKLGGLLVEIKGSHVAFGLGVNLKAPEGVLAYGLPAVGLDDIGIHCHKDDLARAVYRHYMALIADAETKTSGKLFELWQHHSFDIGSPLSVIEANGQIATGTYMGLDRCGRLRLKTENGMITLSSGDVSPA